jgi:hypothetical protein
VILYLAGEQPPPERHERLVDKAGANNFLFSFAYKSSQQCAKYFCVQPHRRLFIDSGAYTAWTKGKKIKLGDYIAFCKQIMGTAKCPVVFAALDVIAGSKEGGTPTAAELEKGCEQGWANYQTMKEEGIRCLMTFHQYERKHWLTRIADDSDYFAVSPRKDIPPDERFTWLKGAFRYIGVSKKIHGLGVSSVDWMEALPFFSVDSTAWLQGGKTASYRYFDGRRAIYLPPERWSDAVRDPKGSFVERYRPGKPDPDANHGIYWFVVQAMIQDTAVEDHLTDHWQARGVVWPNQRPGSPWNIKSEETRRLMLRGSPWEHSPYMTEKLSPKNRLDKAPRFL